MNAFLRDRTTFGFEYLISFRAEHSGAEISRESEIDEIDPKIKRIWSRRFKGGKISKYGLKFSRKLAELEGRKLVMAPNRMFQQLTDKTKTKTRNFQKFSSDDGNESLQYNPPLPPSLDSTYKDP